MPKETDLSDDWMNPRRSCSWTTPPPPKMGEIHYVIQRKKAIPVSGNVSAIYRWERWSKHGTAAERDAELARLREEHPAWRLRARDINAWAEYHNLPQPGDDD